MSVKNIQKSVDAFEFHTEAMADAESLDKGDETMSKAIVTNVGKYAKVGERIRSLGVTYGDYARAAMFATREEWLAYSAQQKENGVSQPRPTAQTSFQRSLWIANRAHADKVEVKALIDQYLAERGLEKVDTLDNFAKWCNGSTSTVTKLSPLEKFMKECRRALPELGSDECLRVLGEAIDEIG